MFYITKGKMILKGVEKLCGLLMEGQIFRQREMNKININLKYKRLFININIFNFMCWTKRWNSKNMVLWKWALSENRFYGITKKAIEYIEKYAKINDIKIETTKYSYKDMSYDDYVLKRNLAIENSDADIILDNIESLYRIKKHAGDYRRLDNYENIVESFRGGFCIKLCYDMNAIFVRNEILDLYGIKTDRVITLKEYYGMKQTLKENGVRFKLIATELNELIDYYVLKNDLKLYKDTMRH